MLRIMVWSRQRPHFHKLLSRRCRKRAKKGYVSREAVLDRSHAAAMILQDSYRNHGDDGVIVYNKDVRRHCQLSVSTFSDGNPRILVQIV